MKKSFCALTLSTLLLGGCVSITSSGGKSVATTDTASAVAADPKTDRQELVRRIAEKFDDPRFANAHWGVLIKSLTTGETWYERNSQRLFMPASNEKIPTTAAALLYLGPDFKYETNVCHTGTIEGETLNGDLVVFGNGDPTLYTRFHKDSRDVFREWAQALKAKGIKRITGNVIGDDNAWDDEHIGSGWPADELTPWYYAEYGALQYNENYVDLTITAPAEAGGPVTIEPNVPCSYFTIVNKLTSSADRSTNIDMYRPQFENTITISGNVKPGSGATERTPTITNPTKFYVTALTEVLREEGIKVDGKPMDCDDIDGWKHTAKDFPILATHQSPELIEILKGLMKRSQNMYAETMAHTMGWKRDGIGTFNGGRRVVQDQLKQFGIEPDSFQYSDGSGLSRYNYISPEIIVKIYEGFTKHQLGGHWKEAQSIAGKDGTLRSRCKGTKAEGNLRGKTGTISNVRSLSGYLTTAGGEDLAISFIVNAHLVGDTETNAITDGVAVMLAEYEGKPPAVANPQ